MTRPKCITKYCRRRARKQRRKCRTCEFRAYTAKHPDMVAFHNLKKSANRRGISFSLTIEQFRVFAAKYDYLNKRGRQATGYTVDRDKEWEGYHAENLKCIPNSANVAKAIAWCKQGYAMAKVHGWHAEEMMEPF